MLRSPTPVLRAILASRSTIASPRQFARKMTQNSAQGGSYAATGRTNHGKKSSDMPWLVGSIAVTVPSVLYLLYSSPARKTDRHHSDHHSSSSPPGGEGGASSSGEAAKSQMDPTPEPVSEATEDSRDKAKEELGEASGLYGGAKDKAEASIMSVIDKAASVKAEAGETLEPMIDGFKSRAHGGDKSSKEDAGKPNQGEGKGPDDNQVREGVDITKEPVGERKEIEKTGDDSQPPEALLNQNKKQNPSKSPSQVDPPAAGMKDPASSNETSGRQEGLSNSDTSHPILHDKRGDAMSEKSEGSHQTAKLEGAVDPKRSVT